MATFRVLNPKVQEDFDAWVSIWLETHHQEVQAHPSYGLAVTPASQHLLGAIATCPTGSVIFPFVVRPLPFDTTSWDTDAITPYGYGGAYLDGEMDSAWFWDCWDDWARATRVAGVTIRSHLFEDEVLPVAGETVSPLDNIVVDLTLEEDQIWSGYEGRVRTDIRRGRDNRIEVTRDEVCAGFSDFYSLYSDTMSAKGADDFYLFDRTKLQSMISDLPGRVVLFHARVGGRLAASEMQLVGNRNAYYFLSGSNSLARTSRANPVMKHEVIMWLQSQGLERYILGGGLKRNDSLYRYKRAYAPLGTRHFTVTFHECATAVQANLVHARKRRHPEWSPAAGFVPAYRAPASEAGTVGGESA